MTGKFSEIARELLFYAQLQRNSDIRFFVFVN